MAKSTAKKTVTKKAGDSKPSVTKRKNKGKKHGKQAWETGVSIPCAKAE